VGVWITGKIDRPHVAWRGAPLDMTDGTNGGAQGACSLKPRCFGEVDPEPATRIYLIQAPQIGAVLKENRHHQKAQEKLSRLHEK
jgi:hypothetical protein